MLMRKQNRRRGPVRPIRDRLASRPGPSAAEIAWMRAERVEPTAPDPIQIVGPNLMMIATEWQNTR